METFDEQKLLFLERTILKIYKKAKENENRKELFTNLKFLRELEKEEIHKLTLVDAKKILKNIQKKFHFSNNIISVDDLFYNALDNLKYSSSLFYYNGYMEEKMIYNRFFHQLQSFIFEDPSFVEEKEIIYEGQLYDLSTLEKITGIYIDEMDIYLYGEDYLEYAMQKDHLFGFYENYRKKLENEVNADLYLQYMKNLYKNQSQLISDDIKIDRIYNLSFIDPLIEKKVLDYVLDQNLSFYMKQELSVSSTKYCKLYLKKLSFLLVTSTISEILSYNDFDLGILDGKIVSNDQYHYNNCIIVALKLIFLNSIKDYLSKEQLENILNNSKEEIEPEEAQSIIKMINNEIENKQLKI